MFEFKYYYIYYISIWAIVFFLYSIKPYYIRDELGTSFRNVEIFYYTENKTETADYTFVSQSGIERLVFLQYFLKLWKGPLSITFFVLDSNENQFLKALEEMNMPSRMYVSYLTTDSMVDYPINALRNVAINNVKTTHFWLTDMDNWPSIDLYETLLQLPAIYQNDNYAAIIVPAFQINKTFNCTNFYDCAVENFLKMPSSKDELLSCLSKHICTTINRKGNHAYLTKDWYKESDEPVTKLPCMMNIFQEPYIVVRRSKNLPLFDETFKNYGFNKQEWIYNLELLGYWFYVLNDAYGIDIYHPPSNYKKKWHENKDLHDYEATNTYNWQKFLKKMRLLNTNVSRMPMCPEGQKIYE